MKRSNLAANLTILLISAFCLVFPARAEEPASEFIDDDLQILRTKTLPLAHDRLTMLQPDGQIKHIPVTLSGMVYMCRNRAHSIYKRSSRPSYCLFCYELRAKDDSDSYTWSAWPVRPAGNFRLITNGPDENYLAWVVDLRVFHLASCASPLGSSFRVCTNGVTTRSIRTSTLGQ